MKDTKYSWIKTYLTEHFPGSEIEHKHDFDLRAQAFKVHLSADNLLLKVDENFVADNNETAIAAAFRKWDVAALLKQNSEQIVLITSDGPLFRHRK